MRAGLLRRRITIQYPVETPNEYGEPETTWADLVTVWAALKPLSGNESMSSDEIMDVTRYQFIMRYYPHWNTVRQIKPKMRVVTYDVSTSPATPTYYDILAIKYDEQRRQMTIETREGMNLG